MGRIKVEETYQLISEKENSLQAKLAITEVEQILKWGTKKVKDHGVVVTFCTKPSYEGYTDTSSEGFVDFRFILELGMFGFNRFKFNGYLFSGDDVDSEVDVTCEKSIVRYAIMPSPAIESYSVLK